MVKPIKLVISFDDTGSMSSVRMEVRRYIEKLLDFLFSKIPGIEIGIIIHNDYCDRDLVQLQKFSSNKDDLISFVNKGSSRGGGDYKEAYAYVLNEVATKFDWEDAEKKILVMIGDAPPHEKGEWSAGVEEKFDWKERCSVLADMGVSIYSIQALYNRSSTFFYESMARMTNGVKLDLSQFSHINDYLQAIIHKQDGTLDEFQESKPEYKTNISLKNMFQRLRGKLDHVELSDDEIKTISKFQILDVGSDYHRFPMRDFVGDMGLTFRKGRSFYQLVKSELVQKNKEVLFIDKETGKAITDTNECREMMGLPFGVEGKVSPRSLGELYRKYDIFIQSNSYTRKLDGNTKFLYELDHK
jgi:hypothetical protein